MRGLIVLSALFISLNGFSQASDSLRRVKYSTDFEFKDGVYFNFEQVTKNAPLLKTRIISTYDYYQQDFFDLTLKKDYVSYYDENGVKQVFPTKEIWGYSKNGVLFVRVDEKYSRITIVGAICHFVAVVTNYQAQHNAPYHYNSYTYQTMPLTNTSEEMKQFIMDFRTGIVMNYNVESMEALLMQDTKLYDEYISLKKKEKKKLKFFYIRKFNERNPIYLPIR